jgi:tetratricopeptide (TPR) repeat protein
MITCLFLTSMCAPLPAFAQGPDEARACFDRGISLYERGEFEKAVSEFERAYALRPSFKILYNLALAATELGRYAEAVRAYSRYLDQGSASLEPERIAWVNNELERLKALTAYVIVEGGAKDAILIIDNVEEARLPLAEPLLVDMGRHTIVVEHLQNRTLERVVRLASQETLRLDLRTETAPEPDPAPTTYETATPARVKRLPVWPFAVSTGLAVASAGGLVAFDFATRSAYDKAKSSPQETSHVQDFEKYQRAEWVMLGATAACGITAVVLAFFTRFGQRVEATAVLLPSGAAVMMSRSF